MLCINSFVARNLAPGGLDKLGGMCEVSERKKL